jgi:hypothetical protein
MTEVGLQCSRVVPFVCQSAAAGVPEHVRVNLQPQLGLGARSLDHPGKARRGERCAALRRSEAGSGSD